MPKKYTVFEVYKSSGVPEYTRIDLKNHDLPIESFLNSDGEHLIIHGPSKSGKSTLWQSRIGVENTLKIPCNNTTSIQSVYEEIADELDAYFESSRQFSDSYKRKFHASVVARLPGFSANGGAESGRTRSQNSNHQRVASPVVGARTISKYLKDSEKFVVLENIHYSSQNFRNDLSKDLHNFSDYKCKFVVVGVQHQADQVFIENRDLVGRLKEIRMGWLKPDPARKIIELGEEKLNIEFSNDFKKAIIRESFGNPALIQDISKNACLLSGIKETGEFKKIDDICLLEEACKTIATSSEQVYRKFCDDISKGGRSDGSTSKYKWFLKLIRDQDIPVEGLLNTEVFRKITDLGHQNINQTSVTQGLQYTNKLQIKRNINPPVMEYDEDKTRLYLLDPYFKFSLRWIPGLIEDAEN